MPDYKKISFRNKDIDKVRSYRVQESNSERDSISVTKRSVDSARAQKGAFKPRPEYKGTVLNSGVKLNDGTFIRTTNPIDRKKALKNLEYDKKMFTKDSIKQSDIIRRFSNARRNN